MKDRQVNPCVQGSRARDTKGRVSHHFPNPNLVLATGLQVSETEAKDGIVDESD